MSKITIVSGKAFFTVCFLVCLFLTSCNAVVYSKSGCCICKKDSKEKIFFPSENYEHLFTVVFGADSSERRSGFICRPCYMAIKKWEKTKKTSQMVSAIYCYKFIQLNLQLFCATEMLAKYNY